MNGGTFAALLRGYRQAANLTQEELAARAGLSVHSIGMLERGVRRAPRTSTVEWLAGALALDTDARAALVAAARARPQPAGPANRDPEPSDPRPSDPEPALPAVEVATLGSRAPAELPRLLGDHVGRTAEFVELTMALAGAGKSTRNGAGLIGAAGGRIGTSDGRIAPGAGGRVAAIVGMGGIGKTSLAVRVATDVSANFPDGVIYVDLKGTDATPSGPGTVLTFLLRTLGVQESDIPADVDRRGALLRTVTSTRHQLFVFDNARDAAQVRPLLPGNDDCGVLVTSRDRLAGLAGAHHVTLHPLDDCDARTLLAGMVEAGRLDAEPDASDELVARCAGHPLALRIAGCRLAARPTHTVRSLVGRLARTSTLVAELTAGDLAVRPAFETSFRHLLDTGLGDDRAAADAFRVWGVWPGGDIGLPAVCAMLGQHRRDTEHAIDHLLDSHLLESPRTDVYRMHDLLTSYAQELAGTDLSPPDRSAVLGRLIGWYLHAANRAVAAFAPYFLRVPITDVPEPPELPRFDGAAAALDWCDAERANLVAVVGWAAGANFDLMAWQLALVLLPFFEQRMLWPEWVDAYTVACASARRLGDDAATARALGGLAAAYRRSKDPERAIAVAMDSLDIYHRIDLHERAASVMDTLARAQRDVGRVSEAMATLAAIGDDERVSGFRRATSLCHLGMIKRETGADDAVAVLQRALRIARAAPAAHAEIPTLQALGLAYEDRGDADAAAAALTECVARSREVSDRIHEAEALQHLARVAAAGGDSRAGRLHLARSLELMTELDHPGAPAVRRELDALREQVAGGR